MKFSINVDGRLVEGWAQKIGEKIWIHCQGETYAFDFQKKRFGSREGEGLSNPSLIIAPMPGKITKVLIQAGEGVTEGQPLLVMEAMKMEYTLKSGLVGVVESLFTKEGDQVQLNQKLVELKAI